MSRGISKWRWASQELTILGIPCIAFFPVFIFLFHFRWWTFYLSITFILFFAILSKFGLSIKVLLRKLSHLLRGNRIYSRPWYYRNRFKD